MKTCKCGETDQGEFNNTSYDCRKYRNERQKSIKVRQTIKRRELIRSDSRCIDVPELSISGPFKRLCFARRNVRQAVGNILSSYCCDCVIQDKVDSGFVPVNIKQIEA